MYLGALDIAEWGIPEKIISNQILVVCTHSNYDVKLEVVTKSTDVGRKCRIAKTKTVLKSMNKMEQLVLVLKPCRN